MTLFFTVWHCPLLSDIDNVYDLSEPLSFRSISHTCSGWTWLMLSTKVLSASSFPTLWVWFYFIFFHQLILLGLLLLLTHYFPSFRPTSSPSPSSSQGLCWLWRGFVYMGNTHHQPRFIHHSAALGHWDQNLGKKPDSWWIMGEISNREKWLRSDMCFEVKWTCRLCESCCAGRQAHGYLTRVDLVEPESTAALGPIYQLHSVSAFTVCTTSHCHRAPQHLFIFPLPAWFYSCAPLSQTTGQSWSRAILKFMNHSFSSHCAEGVNLAWHVFHMKNVLFTGYLHGHYGPSSKDVFIVNNPDWK